MKGVKLVVLFMGLLIAMGTMASCKGKKAEPSAADAQKAIIEEQKTEVKRLAGFVTYYSPDDESEWARNEAMKQLDRASGRDEDFYADQARVASAVSYIFYGMGCLPMCYHITDPINDLKQLSANIVRLDSVARPIAQELPALQLKAMRAFAFYHHAQGVDDAYQEMTRMIDETEKKNATAKSVREQLVYNQVLQFQLLCGDLAAMGVQNDNANVETMKAVADTLDNCASADVEKLSDAEFRKHLSKMIQANCKLLNLFNNELDAIRKRNASAR